MAQYDVVIVGGGFCGLHVAKLLEKKLPEGYSALLIDKKDFFEFTPAILKLATRSHHSTSIRVPYQHLFKRVTYTTEEVIAISPKNVQTTKRKISFRYLVIASGVSYPVPLKNAHHVFTFKNGEQAILFHDALAKAKRVVIVGGGLIGTELAGELATKTDKKVTIIEPGQRILGRNTEAASRWASKWLLKHGCTIIFNERAVAQEKNNIVTDKGKRISADIVAWCAGIQAESSFLQDELKNAITERKTIRVNEFLQVQQFTNIFCGGDLNSIVEEKTAQNADRQARVIVHNLLALLGKKRSMIVHRPRSGPLIISLGNWAGLMIYGNIVFTGLIPGLLKHVVEKLQLFQIKYL